MAETVAVAARELGIAPGTLRRWIHRGAPVARRGGRGRGRCTLVDVSEVRAWRRSQTAQDALLVLAREIPDVCADACYEALQRAEGPHKRDLAGALAASWFLTATALLDRLRERAPGVPELVDVPEKIERLRSIFEGLCTLPADPDGVGDDGPHG